MNTATFDFEAHLARQAAFSALTFGPGARTEGICDHIRKELAEVAAAPGDLKEWIDVAILALDGAWRCGATPAQIVEALVAKQIKNEGRAWPDWRIADPAKAIEHDRSGESKQSSANGKPQPIIGRLMDQISALPVLWGLNEPGALLRNSDVFRVLAAAGREQAALVAAPVQTVAVPDGWKLVPAEPNDAMQTAGAQAVLIDTTVINKIWTGNAVFRAMIAAAPVAPAHRPAEQWDALNSALQRAASELPDSYTITVEVECGYGGVSWCNPGGERCDEYHSNNLAEDVIDALADAKQDAAITAGASPSIESEAA